MRTLQRIKDLLIPYKQIFADRYQITAIGIFGSYARETQTPTSDVDILIDYEGILPHHKFMELRGFLGELLQMDVDLLSLKCLKPGIRSRVLADVIWLKA